ncbi:MAG: hypothetical protein RL299_2194 [Pseudomonadota bacterium]|jgi:hypothetical protein
MTLIAAQRAFVAEIAADDDLPSSSLGMAIYRNAYRGRLSEALATSFERTKAWVGEEMFELAAAHYILSHPPQSWTLDAFGTDFPEALAELFAEDLEVAELAWLEWHMQQAFAAPDRDKLTGETLAAAQPDWESLRLAPAAGLVWREVGHDLAALWHGLSDRSRLVATDPAILLVWRKDLSPHFRLLEPAEFAALEPLLKGASFGSAASQVGEADLARFGQWFAQWLSEGLFSAIVR